MLRERQLIQVIKRESTDHDPGVASFSLTPLKPGWGVTIGNPLRRALYSSLDGYAITHVQLPAARHEFDSIEGIVEDVANIILNLKQVRFKPKASYTGEPMQIEVSGKECVTAADLEAGMTAFSVVNPDQLICRLSQPAVFSLSFVIGKGCGYVASEEHPEDEALEGFFAIDAVYSPVRKVGIDVQNTLHGDRTDYDMLTISIETDGTLSAEEALQRAASNLTEHFSLLYKEDMLPQQEEEEKPVDKEFVRMKKLLGMSVKALGLKTRAVNNLLENHIEKIWQLVAFEYKQLVFVRYLGKKSIVDIANALKGLGLSLGMDVSRYGYRADPVKLIEASMMQGAAEAA